MATTTTYTKEIGEEIARLMAEETWTMREACRKLNVVYATCFNWKNRYPEFEEALFHAREAIADGLYDDIRKIEKKLMAGDIEPDKANSMIHSKQWAITKFGPRLWADRKYIEKNTRETIAHEHTHKLVIPDDMSTEQLDALEAALKATVFQLEHKKEESG